MAIMFKQRFRRVLVSCDACRHQFKIESNVDDRPHPTRPGVTEYGLRCPRCSHFVRMYSMTKQLRQLQKRLKEAQEQARFMKTEASQKRAERLKQEYQVEWAKINPPRSDGSVIPLEGEGDEGGAGAAQESPA